MGQSLNPAEFIARAGRRSSGAVRVSRNEAGMRLNESMSRGPGRRAIKSLVNRGLALLGVGDCLKVYAVRRRGR